MYSHAKTKEEIKMGLGENNAINLSGAMTLVLCYNPISFFLQLSFTLLSWLFIYLCYHQYKENKPICLHSGSSIE